MNKTVKRALLIAGGVVAACGIIWGGLTLARNAQRGNVDVYAVSDFAMTDYWGDTSQTSGMVSTDKMQKIYLSSTQKVSKIYVEEGQTVKKGDKLLSYDTTLTSLDIERAEIDYEKQKLAQKNAEKELNQLMLAQDQEAVDKKIADLQAQIDALIGKNQQDWYDKNSKPIESVAKLEDGKKAPPLQDPLGDGTVSDGSKAKPYYFNWNTGDALSAENLELARRVTENTQTLTALVAQRMEDQLKQGVDEMEKTIKDIEDFLNDPKRFDSLGSQISDGVESALDGVLLMTEGNVQLKLALQQIEQGEEQLAQTRKQVLEQLDLDGMLSVSMVEQLLTAQDFSMPAGYIDDNAGVSYMVSVGNEIRTSGELEDMVLLDLGMDGIEPVTLGDIATVVVTDNAGELSLIHI